MRAVCLFVAAAASIGACASAGSLHGGRTALAQQEAGVVAHSSDKSAAGFLRIWKAPGLKGWALLKWDQDHSSAVTESPPSLLQAVRDEVGRLNQRRTQGEDLLLTVTIYSYDRGGWFTDPTARCELVARGKNGQVRWAIDDELTVRRELAQTLVDSDEVLLGRELVKKLRQEFGL